ncbi:hypothetical protein PsorP6_016075 [Peronosclerospora sorghi]|uniref:Uncharacterized protein n=1 Tax=Peronosclerospora sorghi TaxID=230839 RepID=A0ACC0WM66_9STRA|nr:hypothetical protein PsorP6_016075 [Peronosclerospora sorghi]
MEYPLSTLNAKLHATLLLPTLSFFATEEASDSRVAVGPSVRAMDIRLEKVQIEGKGLLFVDVIAQDRKPRIALNPYRKIEEVFLNVWFSGTHPSQVVDLREQLSLPSTSPDEKLHAIVQELGAAEAIKDLVHEASRAETIDQVAQAQARVVHSLPPTTPAKIKAEVVDLVTSTMYKGFGVKHETNCTEQYAARRQLVVKDQNLVFFKKKVATISTSNLFVGGKADGRTDKKVIEVKNRVKRFLTPLPRYDIAQLQTCLYILGVEEGELVERLCTTKTQRK